MAYILRRDRPDNSADGWNRAWTAYAKYLKTIRERLPTGAYEFAVAPWHYDFQDHRSPHDAWLESLILRNKPLEQNKRQCEADLTVYLLGAYHDGRIEITYSRVKAYMFESPFCNDRLHEDWLCDEVRISDRGHCLHEVEWSNGTNWLIEAEDVSCSWAPFEES